MDNIVNSGSSPVCVVFSAYSSRMFFSGQVCFALSKNLL